MNNLPRNFFIGIIVGFFLFQIFSVLLYFRVDERPLLPKGYEIVTNGDDYKWKKYYPFFFRTYTSIFSYETKEEAIEMAWKISDAKKKPSYNKKVNVRDK